MQPVIVWCDLHLDCMLEKLVCCLYCLLLSQSCNRSPMAHSRCICSIYKSMRRKRQYFRAGIVPRHHWPWIKPQIHFISEGCFCVLSATQLLKFCQKWCREEFKIELPRVTALVLVQCFLCLHDPHSWLVTCIVLGSWFGKNSFFPTWHTVILRFIHRGMCIATEMLMMMLFTM